MACLTVRKSPSFLPTLNEGNFLQKWSCLCFGQLAKLMSSDSEQSSLQIYRGIKNATMSSVAKMCVDLVGIFIFKMSIFFLISLDDACKSVFLWSLRKSFCHRIYWPGARYFRKKGLKLKWVELHDHPTPGFCPGRRLEGWLFGSPGEPMRSRGIRRPSSSSVTGFPYQMHTILARRASS
jgi:hypothetical protein